jgi:hypothetical protein
VGSGLRSVVAISIVASMLLCAFSLEASAVTRRVPSQIKEIQAALDSSAIGDTVLVEPGEYLWTSGPLTFRGKNLVLLSEAGPRVTVLRSSPGQSAVAFDDDLDRTARIEGFTVSVGEVAWCGAICVTNSSPTIENCVVAGNRSGVYSSGIVVYGGGFAFPLISNTVIAFNTGGVGSGIATVGDATAEIVGCTIHGNSSGAIPCEPTGAQVMDISSFTLLMTRTNITGSPDQTAIACESVGDLIECCNFFGNACGDYEGCLAGLLGASGNISADPLYCDPTLEGLDFSVGASSPCLPGNHPDGAACNLIGARGEDCVTTATTPATWGRVKVLFR